MTKIHFLSLFFFLILFQACNTQKKQYDTIIRNGTIYNGSGDKPIQGDIAINNDTIVAIGNLTNAIAKTEIDAKGMAVAPGFINMLSWATVSLLDDGRSQSDIRQGVTLEVMGEGRSMGPLNPEMKKSMQKAGQFEVAWNTLGEYLSHLEKKGVSTNVASFIGATTLRVYTVGYEDRAPTEAELDTMRALIRQGMEEGAMGIGSALIYAPAFYAETEELIEMCKVAAEYDGMYTTHIRSESNRILESMDEVLRVAKETGVRAEIYHLKAAGKSNWKKLDQVIAKIDSARQAGIEISTNMYTYIAAATGLDAAMPPWIQEGGFEKWSERLQNPEIRKKALKEMTRLTNDWENLMYAAGDPEKIILVGFINDSLKYLTGKTLGEVSKMRNTSPEETAMDLVVQDGSQVGTVYFLMSEENVKKQIQLPWMSFCSDARSVANEGKILESSTHPRTYGNFARLLGKYVREEKVIPMEEAIHKLTALPASHLKIKKRGSLKLGYYADIVIFDPEKIQDHATFDNPHQYSTGMVHVFVNGTQVLKDGEHTGATPGRFVKGPGYKKD